MTEVQPGWTYRGIHLRIHQDIPAAARAYVELVRSSKADGTLIQHRAPGMSVDLVDGRTVKFISRADASRPQGWAIASFEVAEGVELSDATRGLLIAATASGWCTVTLTIRPAIDDFPDGKAFCHRCEKVHPYCECDEYAHLGTHSTHDHRRQPRPHPMGE